MTIRMHWRRALAAGLLAATATGCRTSAIYVPAVRTHLAVQPAEIRGGDTVRIAVTIANPGPDTVVLEFGDEECPAAFTLLDPSDRAVPMADAGARCLAAERRRLVLAPGATWEAAAGWHASRADGEPLPAGSYVVAAVLGEHDSLVRGRREYKMGSGAGRVPLRVLPAQEPAAP